jgi:uncharacterized membrane protein YsdA (DUF1294 family)/cold shock CspA family protein
MRFNGTIKSWNDERGFGFIAPTQGGPDVFVHIKAFNTFPGRPQVNQRVSFQVRPGPQGKRRAVDVEFIGVKRIARASIRRNRLPPTCGKGSLFLIPLFAVVLLMACIKGDSPSWLPLVYLGVSLAMFAVYAWDKSAAQRGEWRTPEQSLHLLAIFGGWPGALIAQQTPRHKSSKREFRAVFWATVWLNIIGYFLSAVYVRSLAP